MQSSNPFNKWKLGFRTLDAAPANPGGNTTPANHKVTGNDQLRKGSVRLSLGEQVNLPRNLYAPPSAQSVDISSGSVTIPALTVTPMLILSYIAQQQCMTQLLEYAINTDGPGLTFFSPSVNGYRVFPQNGLPSSFFLISTPTGPDLGNNSLIPAQLPLKPGDNFSWFVQNLDVVDHVVAVRSTGHSMSNQAYEDTRFGG